MTEYKRLKPFNDQLFTERYDLAKEHGYTLTKKIDKSYGEYVHDVCGTVVRSQFHHANKGNLKCRTCMISRFKNEASGRGYEFIEQVSPGDVAKYKHKSCSEVSEFQINHMRVGSVTCNHCKISGWKADSVARGYEWVGQVDKNLHKYKHTTCGRVSTFSPACMRRGNVCCRLCQEDRYKREAALQGYEWLNRAGGTNSVYRHTKCGHTQKKQLDAMRQGRVSCVNCEVSWYTKKSSLYLYKITHNNYSWLKLGISINPINRYKRFGLATGCDFENLIQVDFETGEVAVFFENKLHKEFEQYQIDPNQMIRRMSNGFTECYYIECENALRAAINNLKEQNKDAIKHSICPCQ